MSIGFHTPTLTDRAAVFAAASAADIKENDASFANIYLLRHKYGIEIASENEMLLRRYDAGFRAGCYGFPIGSGDLRAAVCALASDAQQRGISFRMTLLTQAQCELLSAEFPGAFSFTQAEGYTEYLYLRENLAEMKGSRYHGKRNHMAQFWRGNPTAEIQPLIAENAEYAVEIARQWLMHRADPQEASLQAEFACIQEAAAQFDALHLTGLLLYADGKPIGMTMLSEISPGIFDVHFEKVVYGFPHAWSVVVNEMAKCLPQAEYLNREEDLGESGMRSSKQSYHPDIAQEKYIAECVRPEAILC